MICWSVHSLRQGASESRCLRRCAGTLSPETYMSRLALLLLLAENVAGQKAGSNVPEEHPPLKVHECTSQGCEPKQGAAVIDANWRWVHDVSGYTNCYDGND
eukprot:5794900-Prymnesium_polylepis.1